MKFHWFCYRLSIKLSVKDMVMELPTISSTLGICASKFVKRRLITEQTKKSNYTSFYSEDMQWGKFNLRNQVKSLLARNGWKFQDEPNVSSRKVKTWMKILWNFFRCEVVFPYFAMLCLNLPGKKINASKLKTFFRNAIANNAM